MCRRTESRVEEGKGRKVEGRGSKSLKHGGIAHSGVRTRKTPLDPSQGRLLCSRDSRLYAKDTGYRMRCREAGETRGGQGEGEAEAGPRGRRAAAVTTGNSCGGGNLQCQKDEPARGLLVPSSPSSPSPPSSRPGYAENRQVSSGGLSELRIRSPIFDENARASLSLSLSLSLSSLLHCVSLFPVWFGISRNYELELSGIREYGRARIDESGCTLSSSLSLSLSLSLSPALLSRLFFYSFFDSGKLERSFASRKNVLRNCNHLVAFLDEPRTRRASC